MWLDFMAEFSTFSIGRRLPGVLSSFTLRLHDLKLYG
jgi:hypothetical protein